MIVRPAEPGWPGPTVYPKYMLEAFAARAKAARKTAQGSGQSAPKPMNALEGGQDRESYPDAIRDWVRNGVESPLVMTPDEVVAASQPRAIETSLAAAHFELANKLWRDGERAGSIGHFNESHRLQPGNWTYKRQAWSLVGNERAGGGEMGRFMQVPVAGEEADWPFASNFDADVAALGPGEYYPKTL